MKPWGLWLSHWLCKENKNNDFFQQFVFSVSPFCTILENIRWTQGCAIFESNQSVNTHQKRVLVLRLTQKSVRSLPSAAILQNGAKWRHREDKLLKKVIIFSFFAYNKYSRRFIKFRWQMEYSDDDFHTFLDLDSVIYLPDNGTVSSLPVFI